LGRLAPLTVVPTNVVPTIVVDTIKAGILCGFHLVNFQNY